jgi:glycerol-3-phosphate O-acyltransferase
MLLGKLAKKAGKLLPLKKPNVSLQRREEIVMLREQLQQFGIELSHLAGDSPQGGNTSRLLELSRGLAQQQHVLHTLSLGDETATQVWLDAHSGAISPQLWEEHRSYIVTMAHIFAGPYPELRAYLE